MYLLVCFMSECQELERRIISRRLIHCAIPSSVITFISNIMFLDDAGTINFCWIVKSILINLSTIHHVHIYDHRYIIYYFIDLAKYSIRIYQQKRPMLYYHLVTFRSSPVSVSPFCAFLFYVITPLSCPAQTPCLEGWDLVIYYMLRSTGLLSAHHPSQTFGHGAFSCLPPLLWWRSQTVQLGTSFFQLRLPL